MSDPILKIGRVVEVSGSKVIGELEGTVEDLYRTYKSRRYTVGQVGSIVKIEAGDKLVFGVVTALRMTETMLEGAAAVAGRDAPGDGASDAKWLEIELFGEAVRTGLGESEFVFQRGVVTYPLPGQGIFVASVVELQRIYNRPDKPSVHVGTLSQAASLPVYLLTDELLGKHFAILGTTGSGKSCSVTVLLRSILEVAPRAHVILLDPHNEYRRAFSDLAEVIDPTTLNLPHWLLNFEESVELFIGKTEHVATSQTNILKDAILAARRDFGADGIPTDKITVDTPVPYRLGDMLAHIDAAMPTQASKQDSYLKIKNKAETLQQDSRFSFMMRPDATVGDQLAEIVGQYLRIPVGDKPLSIIDLSGVPSDVVDVVVSVLCRMVFDFAVWSPRPVQVPVVLICEEAHRYAPRRDDAAFQPTKQALSRIAKEGRKYGVGLGLISQRPSELAESILSQCNTLIALRMSNEQDQNFVQRALPDSVRSLVSILPTLRTQEALVVGEGTVVPVRLRFNDLDKAHMPQSADVPFAALWETDGADANHVANVVRRWRMQERPPLLVVAEQNAEDESA
jgi:DNA helicase HerA-like ATPase